MAKKSKEQQSELSIVTEVGNFGELNIKNPTEKKIKKVDDLKDVIEEAHIHNVKNLTSK